jgi:hypothetical protein
VLEFEIETGIKCAATVFDLGLSRVKRPSGLDAWTRGILYKPEYPVG